MTDLRFSVDVDFTDRTRAADGSFAFDTSRVTVLAATDTEATLTAAQIVGARRANDDGMVIATRIVSCTI